MIKFFLWFFVALFQVISVKITSCTCLHYKLKRDIAAILLYGKKNLIGHQHCEKKHLNENILVGEV